VATTRSAYACNLLFIMAWKKLGLGLRKHHASSTTKSTLDGDGGCGSVHLCVAVRPRVLLLWADESQRARADRYVLRVIRYFLPFHFLIRRRIEAHPDELTVGLQKTRIVPMAHSQL